MKKKVKFIIISVVLIFILILLIRIFLRPLSVFLTLHLPSHPSYEHRFQYAQEGYLYTYWKFQDAKHSGDGKYYQNISEMPKIFWDAIQCKDFYLEKKGDCIDFVKVGIKFYENKAVYEKRYPDFPVDFDIQVKPDSFTVITVLNLDKDKNIDVWAINDRGNVWHVYNDLEY